jgi:hypothetical protein
MNKLKQIDDNCKKQSLALWDYRRDDLCTPGRNWDAVCERQSQTRFKTQKVKGLEEQINKYFNKGELSKFPQEYLNVYTGTPKPTTTTFRPFINGKKRDD